MIGLVVAPVVMLLLAGLIAVDRTARVLALGVVVCAACWGVVLGAAWLVYLIIRGNSTALIVVMSLVAVGGMFGVLALACRPIWAGELAYVNLARPGAQRARIRVRPAAAEAYLAQRDREAVAA